MASTAEDGPLLLLDGMSLAFRAFFALPPEMTTSGGVVTNAVYGFVGMLSLLVREQRPSGVAVAFDLPGTTFRDDVVEDYKGGRDATPPELEPQIGIIIDLLGALAIPVVTKERYEADDVLATLASRARDESRDVIVVTGDRDCFQLVEDPHVRVLYNRRGCLGLLAVRRGGDHRADRRRARRYPLLAALRGDPSDNLPGVPGVGEKTAAKLLSQFEDFDALFAGLDTLTPKLRENLRRQRGARPAQRRGHDPRARPRARRRPRRADPGRLGARAGACRVRGRRAAQPLVEARAPLRRGAVRAERRRRRPPSPSHRRPSSSPSSPSTTSSSCSSGARGRSRRRRRRGGLRGRRARAPPRRGPRSRHAPRRSPPATGLARRRLSALAAGTRLVGHDVKELWRAALGRGVDLGVPAGDAAIAAYLLDSASGRYRLDEVLADATGAVAPWSKDARPATLLDDPDVGDATLRERAAAIAAVLDVLEPRLADPVQHALYADMELPLLRVLARMEDRGIRVDAGVLRGIAEELRPRPRPSRSPSTRPSATSSGSTRPSSSRWSSTTSSDSRRAARRRPASRPTPRRSRGCAASTSSSTCCCATARSTSSAAPTGRAWRPRSATTGGSTRGSARPWRAPAG